MKLISFLYYSTTNIFILILMFTTNTSSVPCFIYKHVETDRIILDCQRNNSAVYAKNTSGYKRIEKNFVQIVPKPSESISWVLYPKLEDNESVHAMPASALQPLKHQVKGNTPLYLRSLEPGVNLQALFSLTLLKQLRLDEFKWPCLPQDTFRFSISLTTLKITNWKHLSCIHPLAFSSLTNLQELEISGNTMLKTIHNSVFKPLISLKVLVLKNAKFKIIPSCQFSNLLNLRSLSITQNEIEIDSGAFVGMAKLTELKLKSWSAAEDSLINELLFNCLESTCSICELPPHTQLNTVSLEERISKLFDKSFSSLCQTSSISPYNACQNVPASKCTNLSVCDKVSNRESQSTTLTTSTTTTTIPSKLQHDMPAISLQNDKPHDTKYAEPYLKPQANRESNQKMKDSSFMKVDTKNMAGTILLCGCAFVVGVLVTAYCWQAKKLSRIKTTDSTKGQGQTDCEVRLISYKRKDSNMVSTISLKEIVEVGSSPHMPFYYRN